MSSAICLIYLVTEYSWVLIPVPRRQPAAASAVIKHAWSVDMQLQKNKSTFSSHRRLFSNRVAISPEADNRFPFPICVPCAGSHAEALGDESVKAPLRRRKKEGGVRGAGIAPRVLQSCPFTPPDASEDTLWPLRGSRSLFTLAHAFPLCSKENRTEFLVRYKCFSGGGKKKALVAARPRLDCRDCCLAAGPSCGVGSDSLSMTAENAAVVSLNICFLC